MTPKVETAIRLYHAIFSCPNTATNTNDVYKWTENKLNCLFDVLFPIRKLGLMDAENISLLKRRT